MRRLAAVIATLVIAGSIAACAGAGSGPAGASPNPDAVRVVATTSIFADLAARVGGARVSVTSLVPKGGEVHTFDPTPSDIRSVHEAKLILRNGLGLDDWLGHLIANAGGAGTVVVLGEDLPGVTYLSGGEGGAASVNPHLWMNIAYGKLYADRIGEALAKVDPAHAADYAAGAEAYGRQLLALDAEARTRLGAVPEGNRTVISFHDAFPYFAAAYGLTVDGTVVDAPGQDPSAAQVTALVTLIRGKGIKAIFAEAQFSEDLVQTIARESGATVVSDLYTDTVGDAPVDTYLAMMKADVDRVVTALGGS